MIHLRSIFRAWTMLFLTLALFAGCSDRDKVTDPPGEGHYLPNNSELNLLENLKTAYILKDLDAYSELFDASQFIFFFDPIDVEDDPRLDPSWGWPGEFRSTRSLFGDTLVLEIKLDFVKGSVVNAVEPDQVPLAWTKVIVTNTELEIDTIDSQGGENIIYKISGDRGTFFFQGYPEELIDGQPRLRITEWRDERVGILLPTELLTWGQIKHAWR